MRELINERPYLSVDGVHYLQEFLRAKHAHMH